MKIATWNINGVNKRLDLLLAWLEATKPDVVALQETKSTDAEFPFAALEAAGYGALAVGQRTWNGVALLARGSAPIEVRRALPGGKGRGVRSGPAVAVARHGAPMESDDDVQARYLEAAVDGMLVATLYVPNGNPQPGPKFDYKLAWLERFAVHAEGLLASGHPVVLAGDYNVVPTDFDIYKTTSYRDNALLQPAPRASYRALLDSGWLDAIRHSRPHEPMYTFWDYLRNRWPRDAGLRIDHLLLSPSLAARLDDAGVDRAVRGIEGASDHAPAWIRLRAT